ncbi:MAG: caleosin family protein [Deltaproteobacteria bacterium]|nr:caleosin family protein [Deltaproteobacteria bacterium]
MTINKLGPSVTLPKTNVELPKAEAKTTSTETAAPRENTALANHIAFFETLTKDGGKTGIVSTGGTRDGLRKLGISGISVAVGGVALTAPFSIRQNKSIFANAVHMDRIQEGVRADGTDTGVFKKDGTIDTAAFEKFWTKTAGPKGYLTDADLDKLVNKQPKGSETKGLGPVAALEWCLLRDLAGQINTKGERVLTLNHAIAFYDGTLFADLAKARESGTLYKPTGATSHDGLKKVAKGLSSQALQFGGADAGEGAKAISAGNLTIDDAASLEYQQKSKTLGPTLAGAFKALCPAGKG